MIGLLTFQRADNYGAVMQAYALQHVIEAFGHECEYLDVSFNPKEEGNTLKGSSVFSKIRKLGNIKKIIIEKTRAQRFKKFREEYIKISTEKFGNDNTIKDNDKYNSYIVGSDQVWNFNITNSTLTFLLHFAKDNKKKSSYASSFGVDTLSTEQSTVFKKYLSRFDNISVREKQGADIVASVIGEKAEVCLDPTLLVNKEQWFELADITKCKKYVLIYAMADSDGLINKAKEIAQKKKLKIIAIGLKNRVKGIKNIRTASPTQWLGLIKNADTVVTNSFHGTAFSLNFNKNLYVEYLPDGWSVNSRLKNIITLFEIENCVIDLTNRQNEATAMDYIRINKRLISEREKSLIYLKRICGLSE